MRLPSVASCCIVVFYIQLLCVFEQESIAQEFHFSQFQSSPATLNPALTGAFDGNFRLSGIQRSQWASITVPFQTIGFAGDMRNLLNISGAGAGLSVYTSKAGDSGFGITMMSLALAYSKKIMGDSTLSISLGMQAGAFQQKINYANLQFDNQYNGYRYDGALSTGENFSRNNTISPVLSAGFTLNYVNNERKKLVGGASMYNITGADQSFIQTGAVRQASRMNLHLSGTLKISDKIDLQPALLVAKQGTFREIITGSALKYIFSESIYNYIAMSGGAWTRVQDAGFITIGLEYNSLSAGVSYDVNYSSLRTASRARGGFEFSVTYILRKIPVPVVKHKVCPEYI